MAPSRTAKASPPASSLGFGATKLGVKSSKAKRPSTSPSSSYQREREDDEEVEIVSPGPERGGKAGPGARVGAARAALLKASKKQLGRPMVQEDTLNWTPEQLILHIFDTDDTYGPAACGSRLDRFHRAQRLGLNPPAEIEVILAEAAARAADEERRLARRASGDQGKKVARGERTELRAARQLNRPYTAVPLDADE